MPSSLYFNLRISDIRLFCSGKVTASHQYFFLLLGFFFFKFFFLLLCNQPESHVAKYSLME